MKKCMTKLFVTMTFTLSLIPTQGFGWIGSGGTSGPTNPPPKSSFETIGKEMIVYSIITNQALIYEKEGESKIKFEKCALPVNLQMSQSNHVIQQVLDCEPIIPGNESIIEVKDQPLVAALYKQALKESLDKLSAYVDYQNLIKHAFDALIGTFLLAEVFSVGSGRLSNQEKIVESTNKLSLFLGGLALLSGVGGAVYEGFKIHENWGDKSSIEKAVYGLKLNHITDQDLNVSIKAFTTMVDQLKETLETFFNATHA